MPAVEEKMPRLCKTGCGRWIRWGDNANPTQEMGCWDCNEKARHAHEPLPAVRDRWNGRRPKR